MTGTCRISRMGQRMRFLVTLVAAIAVVLPAASGAQNRDEMTWYTVEVIVFERASEIGRNAEFWPVEPTRPDLADAVELSVKGLALEELAAKSPTGAKSVLTPVPRAFQLLPPKEHRLTGAWNRLTKSRAYRPLLHVAWIQPGFSSEEARLVHLRNKNAARGAINVARDPSKAVLDGTLRVHRARYLHVQADLLYYRPLDTNIDATISLADDPYAAPRLFRLTESRRMRSRELHYLDHPLFGALVKIWPMELAVKTTPPVKGDLPTDEAGSAQPTPLLPASTQSGSGG